jgi:hypothetical protein
MADQHSPTLKDRLQAALRELADTLNTAKRIASDAEQALSTWRSAFGQRRTMSNGSGMR